MKLLPLLYVLARFIWATNAQGQSNVSAQPPPSWPLNKTTYKANDEWSAVTYFFFPSVLDTPPTGIALPIIPVHDDEVLDGPPSLTQQQTNGNSVLGLIDAPRYPKFLGPGSTPPWGSGILSKTAQPVPSSGEVRRYDWVISRGQLAPDGVQGPVILVNGAFPGPPIEANWGDTIEVTVTNKIDDPPEGTAIHWHGFKMAGTPWEDGVPGVSQCPIAPGETFTYSFKADPFGTSWYHSHYASQYSSGVHGAVIIHGPTMYDYDEDLGPVVITDWYYHDYFLEEQWISGLDNTKWLTLSNSTLINGKMISNCSRPALESNQTCTSNAGISKFRFQSGKTYRLHIINTSSEGLHTFSIDDHEMTVIAYDFVPIEPIKKKFINLAVGQRADIIVEATGVPTDIVFMRSSNIFWCSGTLQPNALAGIYYEDADTEVAPTSSPIQGNHQPCGNDPLSELVPYQSMQPSAEPDLTLVFYVGMGVNSTGYLSFAMNETQYHANYNSPVLPMYNVGNESFELQWGVESLGEAKSVRVVVNNLTPVQHPFHVHGYNFFVLDSVNGTNWTPDIPVPMRANPARRDTHVLPQSGYAVFQLELDNPGVWGFHCHIAWHVSGGTMVNFAESPSGMRKLEVPEKIEDGCKSWEAWTSQNKPAQIASGE